MSMRSVDWANTRIRILPIEALGDLTIYLQLAWRFHEQGAEVELFSNVLKAAESHFPWLRVRSFNGEDVQTLARSCDLLLANYERSAIHAAWTEQHRALSNVALVSAKRVPSGVGALQVRVGGVAFSGASRAFCTDSRAGLTLVDWVNSYVETVFGFPPSDTTLPVEVERARGSSKILIFPTTPEERKNYWLRGFCWLADRLARRGWQVDFVCPPNEQEDLQSRLAGRRVVSCPDIGSLLRLVAEADVVISNDSGGGHLASLLGVRTFTITRRGEEFVWRPGFSPTNVVLKPLFRVKLFGKYLWRPWVPVWRIPNLVGDASSSI